MERARAKLRGEAVSTPVVALLHRGARRCEGARAFAEEGTARRIKGIASLALTDLIGVCAYPLRTLECLVSSAALYLTMGCSRQRRSSNPRLGYPIDRLLRYN